MRQPGRKILVFALFFVSCFMFHVSSVLAEDINQKILDLRKQIEELEKKSEEYKGNIASKQKEAKSLKREIDVLNTQILRLETQVRLTKNQIDSTNLSLEELRTRIYDHQESIADKRQAVGAILNLIDRHDQENLLKVVLKNKQLSDFISQAQQADKLNRHLLAAITVLKNKKEELEKDKTEEEAKKTELERLRTSQKSKQNSLSISRSGKDGLLSKTKGQEAAYQKLLEEAERKEAQFFSELKELESRALASGAFIVHLTATSLPPGGGKALQWPEEDHRLTQGYGYTKYAKRGAYGGAPHNGIDLAGGYGTAIRPVAAGKILASGFNDGFGNWVAVRHEGDWASVYAHMNSPSGLANGTAVGMGDIIGYEGSTGNSTGSHLHISFYKDFFTYVNEKNKQLYFNYFEGSINPLDYL